MSGSDMEGLNIRMQELQELITTMQQQQIRDRTAVDEMQRQNRDLASQNETLRNHQQELVTELNRQRDLFSALEAILSKFFSM